MILFDTVCVVLTWVCLSGIAQYERYKYIVYQTLRYCVDIVEWGV